MWTATSASVRIGKEPVGLPELNKHVLGIAVWRRPLPTDALIQAWREATARLGGNAIVSLLVAAGVEMDALIAGCRNPGSPQPHECYSLIAGPGLPLPDAVASALKADGHVVQYSVSPMLEMYRVDLKTKPRSQQATSEGWACDAKQLLEEFGQAPTHWCELPELLEL